MYYEKIQPRSAVFESWGGGGKTDPNNLDKKKKEKKGKFQLHKNRENPNPCAGKCTIYHFLSIF